MMNIVFNTNNKKRSLMSLLICLFTWSKTFHCELEFSNGQTLTCDPSGGVYWVTRNYNYYEWLKVPMPWITPSDEIHIKNHADEIVNRGATYDYVGALFGRLVHDWSCNDSYFCSELCRDLLAGVTRNINVTRWYSPGNLWETISDYAQRYKESQKEKMFDSSMSSV